MFFLQRVCVIFFERLHDLFWKVALFYGGEVGWFFWWTGCMIFFVERLRDFVCGEVAWFLCVERLHDFSYSQTHSGCIWFIFVELLWFFLQRGCVIFLLRDCVFFVWRGCITFLCEEVACFFVWQGFKWKKSFWWKQFFCEKKVFLVITVPTVTTATTVTTVTNVPTVTAVT